MNPSEMAAKAALFGHPKAPPETPKAPPETPCSPPVRLLPAAEAPLPGAAPPARERRAPKAPPETPKASDVWTPASVVSAWRDEGKVERLSTGLETFDTAMRGGFPFGHLAILSGAPNAGKTAFAMCCAHRWARAGVAVGILGVDEHPLDLTIRLAMMEGFTLDECEARDEGTLSGIASSLEPLPIRMYDGEYSIERAAADVATFALQAGKRAVLIVDSIQTARADAAMQAENPRGIVDANVVASRREAIKRRMVVIATSEMPRSAYRTAESAEAFNDMAAGKESGSIEYQARTLLVLRSVKDLPGAVHVNVPKMKPNGSCEFWLTLNTGNHSVSERPEPLGESADGRKTAKVESARRRCAEDAELVTKLVTIKPGMGEVALRAEIRRAGMSWGVDRINAAKVEAGLVNLGAHARDVRWHCKGTAQE